MPPAFNNFTTKAKEAIQRAHQIAAERSQNHVTPLHLLASILVQEDNMIIPILERNGVDYILLLDITLENIEGYPAATTLSQVPKMFLTAELVKVLESSATVAKDLGDEFVGVETLFLAILEVGGAQINQIVNKFKIDKEELKHTIADFKNTNIENAPRVKKNK